MPSRLLIVAFVVAGCGSPPAQTPALDWNPLESTNAAELPAATGDDLYPELINTVQGEVEMPPHSWGHGQGYVHAPIGLVQKAMRDLLVIQDRRQTKHGRIMQSNTVVGADFSFDGEFAAEDFVGLGNTYHTRWREKVVQGTTESPERIVMRSELLDTISAGELGELLSKLSDSFVVEAVDANTTRFSAMRHMKTLSPIDPSQYMADVFRNVVARTHRQPLPNY